MPPTLLDRNDEAEPGVAAFAVRSGVGAVLLERVTFEIALLIPPATPFAAVWIADPKRSFRENALDEPELIDGSVELFGAFEDKTESSEKSAIF